MRITVPLVASFVLLLPALALATGTVRIQQRDNSVQTYTGVVMKITLTLTSADGASTMLISAARCAPSGALVRCRDGGFSFQRQGEARVIPFKSGTFYINLSDKDQVSPLAKVGPHSVVFALETEKGTHITGSGRLD